MHRPDESRVITTSGYYHPSLGVKILNLPRPIENKTVALQLGLVVLPVREHGLHEPHARLLDFLLSGVLLRRGLLVLRLQALQHAREIILRLFHGRVLLGDRRSQVRARHGHEFFNLLLHRSVAEVHVGGAAARAQVLLGKGLHRVKVTTALVVLEVVGVTVLDGGVAAHADLVAQLLAARGAVDVGNQAIRIILERSHQLVPSWLHALAVASPRGLELHEDTLASGFGVPLGLRRELHRTHTANTQGRDQSKDPHHERRGPVAETRR